MELIGIAADEIIGQTQRASAIIERVRGYAKSGAGKQIEKRQLLKVVSDAVRDFRLLAKSPPTINVNVPPNAYVQVDAVELSLVILNLFKNASEATRHTTDPQVDVKLESNGSMWELAVSDNGPTVSGSVFTENEQQVHRIGRGPSHIGPHHGGMRRQTKD